tara:strand:+ start:419 stop:1147 length:729 start_codon:yes stop_codon:yes gene_type:complete
MFNLAFKIISSILLYSFVGIILLDYVVLPSYVGYNNEHYLPDLRGQYLEKAIYKLNKLGFNYDIITTAYSDEYKSGTVIKMFPRAFTKAKEGRSIALTVSGKVQELIIPQLISLTLRNAELIIAKSGLTIDTVIYEYDNTVPEDHITFQLPKAKSSVKSSTRIILGVSKGNPPDYYIIPDVVNKSLFKAKASIESTGLRVGNVLYEIQPDLLPNTVIDQNMTPGMRVSFPASINLTVSKVKD